MTSISEGDVIRFTRYVQPPLTKTLRDASGGRHTRVTDDAKVIKHGGIGTVSSLSKHHKNIDGVKYRVARVNAGSLLGTVTAILDDAVIVGVQQSMELNDRRIDLSKEVEHA